MKRLLLVTSLLLVAGCALAPGMKMNEGASKDRDFKVESVTPKLLAQLVREAPVATVEKDPLASEVAGYTYRVAPFDVLNVIVWEHPELTIPAGEFRSPESTGSTVGADGTVFYPYAGVVKVAGKTLPEIRLLFAEKLSRVIRNPQLDVRVTTFRGQRVQVTGEVLAPGAVPVSDVPLRVQDAIAFTKGFTPEADPANVTIARGGKVHPIDLQAFYDKGDVSQNWLLLDGDVVNVGDRRHNRVFVVGEVRQPAAKPMNRRRMSLADALADSGWLDPIAANPARIYVIRGDFQAPRVFKLDAESPDALLLATQFPLRPLDVVFVGTYEIARFNRVISQILPTVSLLYQTLALPGVTNTSLNATFK